MGGKRQPGAKRNRRDSGFCSQGDRRAPGGLALVCIFRELLAWDSLVPTEWSMPGRPWSVWQGVGSSGQGGDGGNVRSSGNLNFFKVELWGHR